MQDAGTVWGTLWFYAQLTNQMQLSGIFFDVVTRTPMQIKWEDHAHLEKGANTQIYTRV